MPKLTSKDGSHTIETDVPREVVTLKAQGYREAGKTAAKPKPAASGS